MIKVKMLKFSIMQTYIDPTASEIQEAINRPLFNLKELESSVDLIMQEVREKGDEAAKKYTKKFDGANLNELLVSDKEINQSLVLVDKELKQSIDLAISTIEKFHSAQKQVPIRVETLEGVECWQKAVAIEKVGLYIPGGTAPLFSSVLMLGIPARIANCKEIVLTTPPRKDGSIDPVILYTANRIGIRKIVKLGGVQAIAALAYGTESVPKVFKIFGPGNQYVTMAKQLVSRDGIAIDMPAGPSEVAIMADESANPRFVAADLLSQAEHGIDSQVLLLTTSKTLISEIQKELEIQLNVLPRKEIAMEALKNSSVLCVKTEGEMLRISNEYAPEHLIISLKNADEIAEKVVNAGSVFIGNYTPESAGDYASGTNHTLPTNAAANAFSGVNLDGFMKKITFQKISEVGIKKLGPAIENMADAEGLQAHKNAVSVRLESLNYKGEVKCSMYQVY